MVSSLLLENMMIRDNIIYDMIFHVETFGISLLKWFLNLSFLNEKLGLDILKEKPAGPGFVTLINSKLQKFCSCWFQRESHMS